MNNDETKILKDACTAKPKDARFAGNSAFAAGGFVAGAASVSAFSADAAEAIDVVDPDLEVKMAQVDDDASFAEAFAEARHQVGPGGLFEWNGRVYNTYYKEEWDNMSDAERSEFMQETSGSAEFPVDVQENDTDSIAQTDDVSVELIDEGGEADMEVIVGEINGMAAAQVSSGDEEIYLVDVNDDGTMDVMLADVNHDGIINDCEVLDVSSEGIGIDDIYAMQDPEVCYVSNDSMPDYMNSADTALYQA